MIKKTLFAIAAGGLILSASACNTVHGAGKDVSSVGQAVQKASN